MKLLRKNLLLTVVFSGYFFFFSMPSTTQGFGATTIKSRGMLMREIDKLQWRIGYNFTADCPAAFRQQEKKLQEVIVEALQTWLQPLRARYPNRRFTDDFLLLRQPDVEKCGEDRRALLAQLDTRITVNCRADGAGGSHTVISAAGTAPDLCVRALRGIDWNFTYALVHELGHAFGMDDTYTRRNLVSTGGLARTMGKQPSSMMSGGFARPSPFQLGEDDKNGIIWLYQYLHEGHPAGDCFFPDYVPDGWGDGSCRPQYPLMFEVRHGTLHAVQQILRDDPTLDHNARDTGGNTALHYAVRRADHKIVQALLAQAGIKVNITNKKGRTPAQLARLIKRRDMAQLIEAHPTAKLPPWSVETREKLATIWGQLKQRD